MNILVVGASGYVGRHIVEQAHRRGHRVRAVVRDKARAESAGAWGAPSLADRVDEWSLFRFPNNLRKFTGSTVVDRTHTDIRRR